MSTFSWGVTNDETKQKKLITVSGMCCEGDPTRQCPHQVGVNKGFMEQVFGEDLSAELSAGHWLERGQEVACVCDQQREGAGQRPRGRAGLAGPGSGVAGDSRWMHKLEEDVIPSPPPTPAIY